MRIAIIPAAYFGMVLGLTGLGTAWRTATQLWHFSAEIGEAIMGLAVAVWAVLIPLYALAALDPQSAFRARLLGLHFRYHRPATAPLRLVLPGDSGPAATLAPILFVCANLVVGLVSAGTLWLLVRGRLNLKWTGAPVVSEGR